MARVLISMSEDFLTTVDEIAEDEQRSRSELIREALRTYIRKAKARDSAMSSSNAALLESLL